MTVKDESVVAPAVNPLAMDKLPAKEDEPVPELTMVPFVVTLPPIEAVLVNSKGTDNEAPVLLMLNLWTPPVVRPRLSSPILNKPVFRSLEKVKDGFEAEPSANWRVPPTSKLPEVEAVL